MNRIAVLSFTVMGALAGVFGTTGAAFAHEPGTLLEVEEPKRYSIEDIELETEVLFGEFAGAPVARYEVDKYRIRYRSTDVDGSGAEIIARLFVPIYTAPAERPVLAFGSGTTGVAEHCAPILEVPEENRWGNFVANMLGYATEGYIAIFPDYLGFGDPDTPQRYFSAEAEAHVLLDAIRAVHNFFEEDELACLRCTAVRPSRTHFAAGYSQGGHAAHAAADFRDAYAPEIELAGLIGFAQTNNVATLMREMAYYTPYIIYSYAEIYGYDEIDPAEYLQEQWLDTFEQDVNRLCVEDFQYHYPRDGAELYTAAFYEALHAERLEEEFPAMAARLEENLTGYSGHELPSLVLQGEHDIIISTAEQDRFVADLCRLGSPVRYEVLNRARHRDVRSAGFRKSVNWMNRIMDNDAPPSDCDAF